MSSDKPKVLPALFSLPTNTETLVKKPLMIGVCGGTASGKTTVCEMIMDLLGNQSDDSHMAVLIHQDSFYRSVSDDEDMELYNFDHPDSFDDALMYDCLYKLSQGEPVDIPIYDFITHKRTSETLRIHPAPVMLFEGILSLYHKNIRDLFDLKLFVDCDPDTRLARRVLRDIEHRGRNLDSVLWQYVQFVKPSFDDFIWPTKKYADIIIPRGSDNVVAINLIVQHIKDQDLQNKTHAPVTSQYDTSFPLRSPCLNAYRPH